MTPRKRNRIAIALLGVLTLALVAVVTHRNDCRFYLSRLPGVRQFLGKKAPEDHAMQFGPSVRSRMAPEFAKANVPYPPERIALVALKQERSLELYAAGPGQELTFIAAYPILGASGNLGPKLKEGDYQVPEGFYQATLEPNTPYHLALRLNYPNEDDQKHAAAESRNPGSDILIHGSDCSIGCLAMGDPVSENLFITAYDTKEKPVPVIIVPVDLRKHAAPPVANAPSWLPALYNDLSEAIAKFKK